MACGDMGFGAWIWEIDRGRPLGMSTERLLREERWWLPSLSLEEEWWRELELLLLLLDLEDDLCDEDEDLDEDLDDLCEDDEEDLSDGTSRMLSSRPVVGSVVDAILGLWATWYPSMM